MRTILTLTFLLFSSVAFATDLPSKVAANDPKHESCDQGCFNQIVINKFREFDAQHVKDEEQIRLLEGQIEAVSRWQAKHGMNAGGVGK